MTTATDERRERLLEREEELRALSHLLERADRGAGAVAVIEGPAGIGKTRLLDACARAAAERGARVLRACGDEVAMESPYSGMRELLWDAVRSAGRAAFQGAAGLASPVFEDQGVGADDDRAPGVLHGLYWTVANLADRHPLLLVIDDAHWLDPASSRFLLHMARRIDALSAVLLVALRPGENPTRGGTAVAWPAHARVVLRPAALSPSAAAVLIRSELGPRADEELCRSCHEATAGNPFYLRALTADLRSEGARPTVELARRVRALGGGTVSRSVLVRLARLGSDCERLANAVAVLAPGAPLRHGAELAGLPRERAEVAADRLRAVELFSAEAALSFAHPIVREAVAAQMPPSRRAALHAAAARLLIADGAPIDRAAAHLQYAEPYRERWVVEALRAAAGQALTRGAPEAAVSYLRRALAEPPEPGARLDVLVELGRAEALLPIAHDFTALREALERAPDPDRRAEIALELAWALASVARSSDAAVLLDGILEHSEGIDPRLVEQIEALLMGAGAPDLTMTRRAAARVARHFDRLARGGRCDAVALLPALAQTGSIMGVPAAEVLALARRAFEDRRLLDVPLAYMGAANALAWCDAVMEASQALDAAIAEAQRRGSAPLFAHISVFRAGAALRIGDLDAAEDHAQRAFDLGRELGLGPMALMFLVPVLLERGRSEEALELIGSMELGERELRLWQGTQVLSGRGRAKVALGDLRGGLDDLLDADRRMTAGGCHLSVLADWVPAATSALEQLDRRDEARRLAERELAEAIAFGAPRRHGIALSTCGMLDGGPAGLVQLREAVSILGDSPARLEHGRALVNLGMGLRRRGEREAARAPLAAGLDIAYRCGGHALAEQARTELLAAGGRPRREAIRGPGALTPAELRTARMAAHGLTNPEIAQALFVSTKTVETHLSHAYAKLGIARRVELAGALTATGGFI